ncbi:MAG: alpha-ketoacid dehydrogenase subunit beta [Deltaproteobacteria bacterium]|nr:alpha-ketoacid dehydrogenase subunit beta [Deltaproteobacteria bacterium]MBW1948709.1 alpha-ketoacid dehydrogenase subunit beta [Deltaproteobacteria bacterium]MBW2006878.1 alpha-ketoacid dehydrogenase subunit beta [Deltaproteobacteria bacterium]MBW2347685.1 alpha-ketoacid dehydrogenase subunit beta [Deltaproteobacteria bacterium]
MSERILSASAALAEALHEEMTRDETVFILGEDLTAHAGIFGQFKGIPEAFPGRIIDTPISETCIAGCGVGAALTGMRPIVDFHFSDFVTCGMDELCNQAAKIRYMFGGQVNVPLVVWCPDGAGLRAAAQHSQSLEAWFVHTPGLKVVIPSEPADVKGLIKSAIRDDDPVMFFQHKRLFAREGPVPEDSEFLIPLGRAAVKREGKDVSLLCYGSGFFICMEAAQALAREEIEAEVVDLRTLKPLDMETVASSIRKTNRAVVVHEACLTGGFGSELAARIQEELFDELDAPILRVGARDVPIPFSPGLEDFVLPKSDSVIRAAKRVCYR